MHTLKKKHFWLSFQILVHIYMLHASLDERNYQKGNGIWYFALKVDYHRQEAGSGHEHGGAMYSRIASQEVWGSGARDFYFLGCLRKAFHLLVGTNRSKMTGYKNACFTALFIIDCIRWPADTSGTPPRREACMMRLIKTAFATSLRAWPHARTTQQISKPEGRRMFEHNG